MIVRILGKGQFRLDDGRLGRLNELDNAVAAAVAAGDPDGFGRAFTELIRMVESPTTCSRTRTPRWKRPARPSPERARSRASGCGPRLRG
jgi:hypothetical protein